jgi:uncharacterized protein HemY
MISGSMFRGINYKCAMLHYNNEAWSRAIKEFELIANSTDPHIYEMLAKCYRKLGESNKHNDNLRLAIEYYSDCGEKEKSERLKSNLGV